MKLRSICFLAIFVGLISCGGDELNSDTPLLTISAEPGSIGAEVWIFLTREDGTLIEAKVLMDGADVVFARPAGFTDERFTVHEFVHQFNSRDFVINSYTAIPGGKINYNAARPGTGLTEVGKHNYSFTDVPVGYSPLITGPKVITNTGSGTNGTFSGTTTLGANNTTVLFWFEKYDNPLSVPKYTLAENVSAGQTLSMSFNDLIPASEQPIMFGEKQDNIVVTIGPASPELLSVRPYSILNWRNVTEVKLYHPGQAFDEYVTFMEAHVDNDYQQYVTTGSIPTSFKSMPATINSFSQVAKSFTVTTSGAYDYMIVSGDNRWTDNALQYSLYWAVYMADANTKTFIIPDLPEVIVALYPALSTAPLTGFNFIEIIDHGSVDNYPDFIAKFWSKEPFPRGREFLMRTKLITE